MERLKPIHRRLPQLAIEEPACDLLAVTVKDHTCVEAALPASTIVGPLGIWKVSREPPVEVPVPVPEGCVEPADRSRASNTPVARSTCRVQQLHKYHIDACEEGADHALPSQLDGGASVPEDGEDDQLGNVGPIVQVVAIQKATPDVVRVGNVPRRHVGGVPAYEVGLLEGSGDVPHSARLELVAADAELRDDLVLSLSPVMRLLEFSENRAEQRAAEAKRPVVTKQAVHGISEDGNPDAHRSCQATIGPERRAQAILVPCVPLDLLHLLRRLLRDERAK
mmetsp:Transcript_13356/g.36699  ORF Transcript_13356/g.36699 Transcript_13356/m.36699 type:complete len:280 (+) Transcript_13356:2187-3026(+)